MKRYCGIDMLAIKESGLTLTKWVFLENIHFLSNYTGWCENSRQELAEHHNISVQRLRSIITELVDEKWLMKNKKFQLKTTKKWANLQGTQKQAPPYSETSTQGTQKQAPSTYKKELSKNKYPTLEEISAYILEKNYSVDAKYFFNFYEANDWKDTNGNQVKSWKQKVITWSMNSKSEKEEKVQLWG